MKIGSRATHHVLQALGIGTSYRAGLRCPLLDLRTGEACHGLRASVDGAGRFRCPRCRADLSPLELVQKVRRCDEATARAWINEQVAADAKEHAVEAPRQVPRILGGIWSGRRSHKTYR